MNLMTIYIAAHDLPEATHGIYILDVEVIITLDVSFRLNPVPITSHFGIDSRLVFFSTVHSPAYYSNKIPDVSITWYNQRSSRITLASGKRKKAEVVILMAHKIDLKIKR